VPALGIEGEGDFPRRLTMSMRETVACRLPRRTLLAIGALALLALPGFTLGQDKPKQTDPIAQKTKNPDEAKAFRRIFVLSDSDWDFELQVRDVLVDLQPEDRDQKLAELEARVESLLNEIQALKGKPADKAVTEKHIEAGLRYLRALQEAKNQANSNTQHALWGLRQAHEPQSSNNLMTLLRVTYSLPPGKAAILAKLLNDHAKATPLEAKLDGDKLIVTTTAGNQRIIHAVVDLMQVQDKPK
jgi:hypothetical protein